MKLKAKGSHILNIFLILSLISTNFVSLSQAYTFLAPPPISDSLIKFNDLSAIVSPKQMLALVIQHKGDLDAAATAIGTKKTEIEDLLKTPEYKKIHVCVTILNNRLPKDFPGENNLIDLIIEHKGRTEPIIEELGIDESTLNKWLRKRKDIAQLKSDFMAMYPYAYPGDKKMIKLIIEHRGDMDSVLSSINSGLANNEKIRWKTLNSMLSHKWRKNLKAAITLMRDLKYLDVYPGKEKLVNLYIENRFNISAVSRKTKISKKVLEIFYEKIGIKNLANPALIKAGGRTSIFPGFKELFELIIKHRGVPQLIASDLKIDPPIYRQWLKSTGFEDLKKLATFLYDNFSHDMSYPEDDFKLIIRNRGNIEKIAERTASISTVAKWFKPDGALHHLSSTRELLDFSSDYPGDWEFAKLMAEHNGEKRPLREALNISPQKLAAWFERLETNHSNDDMHKILDVSLFASYPGDLDFFAKLIDAKGTLNALSLNYNVSTDLVNKWIERAAKKTGGKTKIIQFRKDLKSGNKSNFEYPGLPIMKILINLYMADKNAIATKLNTSPGLVEAWLSGAAVKRFIERRPVTAVDHSQ